MNLRALLLDVDGTLADTEETHRTAFNDAFRALGLPFDWSPEDYEALLRVTGGKERLRHFLDGLDIDSSERLRLKALVPRLHETKTARYAGLVAGGATGLRPGVARLLGEARAAGLALGIATTTTRANVEALLDAQLGREAIGWFAVLACGDDVASKKPAPDVYRLALSRLGISPDEAIAFEDSANGLAAAKAAGLFTVVTPCWWTRNEAFPGADLVLPHLGDPAMPLPADAIARTGWPFLTLAALREHARDRTPVAA